MSDKPSNTFLDAPLGRTYAKTALPIIFVMGMNGLLAVTDALFLGVYVGPDALAAVTLMFPIYMLIVALATLVSSGMSSLLARHLGANQVDQARSVYAGAHGLAIVVALSLWMLFAVLGAELATLAAAGSGEIADLGLVYLRITVLACPLLFVLSVNSDALRNEGRVGFMAGLSLLVSISNIGFNYVLIAHLDFGVAGSAYGTVLAQAAALAILLPFRIKGETVLRISALKPQSLVGFWPQILGLGAPQSLNFIGFALGSAAIIAALQMVEATQYYHTVTAYGIITRVITFAFLPLLGLSQAMQTITGNSYGAALWTRTRDSLRFALVTSFVYCVVVQFTVTVFPTQIGQAFVQDPATVAEVARILPIMSATFALSGPLMMIAIHFQAIGDARRAGLLGLSKPYLFAIPLTFLMAFAFGEIGVWVAGPLADVCLLVLTVVVLKGLHRKTPPEWLLLPSNGTR